MAAIFYAIVALILPGYVMRYFNWIIRTVLFLALLGFAFKNKQQVTLSYFFGYEWETPLVVVLLIFFFAGAAVGMLAMSANVLHKRREIAALKRDISTKNKLADIGETPQEPR
jgi:lipopolysaccharide assembly protein A